MYHNAGTKICTSINISSISRGRGWYGVNSIGDNRRDPPILNNFEILKSQNNHLKIKFHEKKKITFQNKPPKIEGQNQRLN
jgi:hypothetical protein